MGISAEQAKEMQSRVDANRGVIAINNIDGLAIEEDGRVLKPFAVLAIDPIGAPRMSRSDQWKVNPNHSDPKKRQRVCVTRYFAWKDAFVLACKRVGWTLEPRIRIEFRIAMPPSWSKKKRSEMNGRPHQQKPDYDNLAKCIGDAFGVDDSFIWDARITKRWAEYGSIILFK